MVMRSMFQRDYCANLAPYYWEIGDANGPLQSGSTDGSVRADTPLEIASASKWLYAAYVAQCREIGETDIPYLQMTAGYTQYGTCTRFQTVQTCAYSGSNDEVDETAVGKFYYGGGHMQAHAVMMGLGAMPSIELGQRLTDTLGVDIAFKTPSLAGGAVMTPAAYAAFLRKLMRLELRLDLGTHQICTNPATCPSALNSPVPEDWKYALGHWVEIDGTFSSPGAFGFYPWISADKKKYGILARKELGSWASVQCGRQIRRTYT